MDNKIASLLDQLENITAGNEALEDLIDFISEGNKIFLKKDASISNGLKYHIDNKVSLSEPIFRENTEKYYQLMIEARDLFNNGYLNLDDESIRILTTDIGSFGEYEGAVVPLDAPMALEEEDGILKIAAEYKGKKVQLNKPKTLRKGDPGHGRKQYVVYVKDGDRVKRITFGDPNLKAKPEKAKNRKSFRARHKCDTKKDKTTPGYWACHYPPNW